MISDAFPHLAKQADELCLLNGMQTNNPGHHQAVVARRTLDVAGLARQVAQRARVEPQCVERA